MKFEPQALSLAQSKRLIELEAKISAGKQTFVEVGLALAEIKASELYLVDYATFDEYCQKKWGWEKRYCQYVIAGAEAVESLPKKLRTIVHSESQARELAKANEEDRPEIVEKVAKQAKAEGRAVTARDIKEKVAETQAEPPPKTEAQRNDDKFNNALGGLNERSVVLAEHLRNFRNTLAILVEETPPDANWSALISAGNNFVSLLSNRQRDQQNMKAYTP